MADQLYADIPGLSEDELAILKRQRIAEAMLAKSQEPVQSPYQTHGIPAPVSWSQGAAKLTEAYLGKRRLKKADTEMQDLADKRKAMIADALSKYRAQSQGGPVNIPLGDVAGGAPTQMQQSYKPDQEGATFDLLANPAIPAATQQAAQMRLAAGYRHEDKKAALESHREDRLDAAKQRLMELTLRLDDRALDRESREQIAREATETRELIASMSQQKAPAGFRYKDDGTLEAIPGGPAAIKNAAQHDKEVAAKKSVDTTLDAEIENINKLIGPPKTDKNGAPVFELHPGVKAAVGSLDVRFPTIFEDTANAEALIESLQSKASISALRDVRSGGSQSIGQITEREWPRLESMKATLQMKQGDAQFPNSLNDYRNELLRMKKDAEAALKEAEGAGSDVGAAGERTVVKTGTEKGTGRKVVQYSDGTTDYAD